MAAVVVVATPASPIISRRPLPPTLMDIAIRLSRRNNTVRPPRSKDTMYVRDLNEDAFRIASYYGGTDKIDMSFAF